LGNVDAFSTPCRQTHLPRPEADPLGRSMRGPSEGRDQAGLPGTFCPLDAVRMEHKKAE
jgi:hypothetical protein